MRDAGVGGGLTGEGAAGLLAGAGNVLARLVGAVVLNNVLVWMCAVFACAGWDVCWPGFGNFRGLANPRQV